MEGGCTLLCVLFFGLAREALMECLGVWFHDSRVHALIDTLDIWLLLSQLLISCVIRETRHMYARRNRRLLTRRFLRLASSDQRKVLAAVLAFESENRPLPATCEPADLLVVM